MLRCCWLRYNTKKEETLIPGASACGAVLGVCTQGLAAGGLQGCPLQEEAGAALWQTLLVPDSSSGPTVAHSCTSITPASCSLFKAP